MHCVAQCPDWWECQWPRKSPKECNESYLARKVQWLQECIEQTRSRKSKWKERAAVSKVCSEKQQNKEHVPTQQQVSQHEH